MFNLFNIFQAHPNSIGIFSQYLKNNIVGIMKFQLSIIFFIITLYYRYLIFYVKIFVIIFF